MRDKIHPSRLLPLALLAAASFISLPTVAFAQLDFAARRDLSVGATPRSIAVGDLNSDGLKDLVITDGSSDSLSILLGAGGGVFRPEVRKATSFFPDGLVLASFNSSTDSFLDAAVACSVGDQVQIFLGNGAGGFGLPTSISTGPGSGPTALAVTDFNGDGKKDLVVMNYGTSEVRLYQGNGLGGFSLLSTLPVMLHPVAVTVGDWDGDLRVDVAVVSEGDTSVDPPPNGTLTVAYGCPTGFCFPQTVSVGPVPASITSGLLNNDTLPDLLVGSTTSDNVAILFGDPDFGFTSVTPLAVGGRSYSAVIADLNGDSQQDLAVGVQLSRGQGVVKIYTGNGLGSFTAGGTFPVGAVPASIAAQDVGSTAAVDLLTANAGAASVSLLFGNGAAGFTITPATTISPTTILSALDSADLNADGKIDLAVGQIDLNQVSILLGSGTGTFSTGPVLALPGTTPGEAQAAALLIRNFTADSLVDIAALDTGTEQVSVFPATGPGTFGARVDYGLGNSCNTTSGVGCVSPQNFAAGPLNDSDTTHPDLVVANSAGDASFPYGSISVFLQSGGGFGAATRYPGGSGPICDGGSSPGVTCTSNLDCRGRCSVTIITLCSADGDCPTGQTCTNPAPGTCIFAPFGVAAGLVDADANRDLVVCENELNKAAFLPGTGTGAFSTVSGMSATGVGPRFPILKDLDGDGDLDLVTINAADSTISSLLGNNAGGFTPLVQVPGGQGPLKGVLVDLNLDGWDDLVVNNSTGGSVAILLGDGSGRFGVPVRFGTGPRPKDVTLADFNADGKPDLAASNEQDGTVSILLNTSQSPVLNVTQAVPGTQISWSPLFEASVYDVIRGNPSQITQTATQVNLGNVVCIENDSPNTDTVGNEDNVTPSLGTAFFYLFRTQDPQVKGSYGRSTLSKLRVVGSGDCL